MAPGFGFSMEKIAIEMFQDSLDEPAQAGLELGREAQQLENSLMSNAYCFYHQIIWIQHQKNKLFYSCQSICDIHIYMTYI